MGQNDVPRYVVIFWSAMLIHASHRHNQLLATMQIHAANVATYAIHTRALHRSQPLFGCDLCLARARVCVHCAVHYRVPVCLCSVTDCLTD